MKIVRQTKIGMRLYDSFINFEGFKTARFILANTADPSRRQRSTNDSRQCSDITNTLNQRLFSDMVTMSPSGREFLNIKEDQVHLTFQAGSS